MWQGLIHAYTCLYILQNQAGDRCQPLLFALRGFFSHFGGSTSGVTSFESDLGLNSFDFPRLPMFWWAGMLPTQKHGLKTMLAFGASGATASASQIWMYAAVKPSRAGTHSAREPCAKQASLRLFCMTIKLYR